MRSTLTGRLRHAYKVDLCRSFSEVSTSTHILLAGAAYYNITIALRGALVMQAVHLFPYS
jgi:hypothetical protein